MTNEHAVHGASTLVSASSNNDLKRMLSLSNDGPVSDQQMEDAILRNEEEKMMDEEITSVESNDRLVDEAEDDNIENAMLNVAIINSVAQGDATISSTKSDVIPVCIVASGNASSQQQKTLNRYGLRQRHNGIMGSDNAEPISPSPEITARNIATNPKRLSSNNGVAQSSSRKLPSTKKIPAAKSNPKPPRAAKRKRTATGTIGVGLDNTVHSMSYQNENLPSTSILTSSQPPQISTSFFNVMTSVPNPLSNILDTSHSQKHLTNTVLSTVSDPNALRNPILQSSYTGVTALDSNEHTVPCPLSSLYNSYGEALAQGMQTNSNVDQSIAYPSLDQKQRVTFSEPMEPRDRSFSIDLDCKFY
jgi:hypothetical protein